MVRREILGLSAALLLAGTVAAAAQSTVVITSGPAAFGPAEEDYIETYVVSHPVAPAAVPMGYEPEVGAQVPEGVVLATFPAPRAVYATGYPPAEDDGSWDGGDDGRAVPARAMAGYRYMVMPSSETVVVAPDSRRVVYILQ